MGNGTDGDCGMTLALSWQSFRDIALPENAPPHQVRAMEMAFMAGVSATMPEVTRMPDGAKQPTIRQVTHNLAALQGELQEWAMEARFR